MKKKIFLYVRHCTSSVSFAGLAKMYFLTALFFSMPHSSSASPINVYAEIDSVALLIGEQAKLSISAIQPADATLFWPEFNDTVVSGLEVVEKLKADTAFLDDGSLNIRQDYIVTAFDSAFIYIPELPVVSELDTFYTNPLSLKILDVPVDTTQNAITDIKNVYKPPFDWAGFLTVVAYVLLGLVAVALIVWLIWKIAKKQQIEDETLTTEPVDPRPAHEIALDELDRLRQKQLWQIGRNKEYHTEITEILRRYIQRRYSISAMELPSEELLDELKGESLLKNKKDEFSLISNILSLADLVKFAKFTPLAADNENAMRKAVEFVETTKSVGNTDTGEENKTEVKEI